MKQLAKLKRLGDPAADDFVLTLLDQGDMKKTYAHISEVLGWLRSVQSNKDLRSPVFPKGFNPKIKTELTKFLTSATAIPSFAKTRHIRSSESYFEENGYLLSLIYLCASLPEVYVLPDISSVLHVTGLLENAAEQRIRSTATMVLSVMLKGGILADDGYGLVLTMRARIIHSILRVLLVRGNPKDINEFESVIKKLKPVKETRMLFELAYNNGWNIDDSGIPCNQMELIYTLLTFGYVYLRSLRRLGIPMSEYQESSYLHLWNVVGSYMGIEYESLPTTYDEAQMLFDKIQRKELHHGESSESQRHLGKALMTPLERTLRQRSLKPMARFLTRFLTSKKTVATLGLKTKTESVLYNIVPASANGLKAINSLLPFSLTEPVYKQVSLAIIENMLIDSNQPVLLPAKQMSEVESLLARWKAPSSTLKMLKLYSTTAFNIVPRRN